MPLEQARAPQCCYSALAESVPCLACHTHLTILLHFCLSSQKAQREQRHRHGGWDDRAWVGLCAPQGIWAAQRSHSQGVQVPMVPPAAKPSDCVVQTGARPWEQVLSIERYRMVKSQRCHRRREGGDSESDETSSRARGRDGGPSEVCRVPVLSSLQGLGEGALKREAGNLGGVGRSTEEREDHITRFQVQNFLKTKIRDHQRKVSQS